MTLAIDDLHATLICDSENGKLWWRERTPDMFKAERDCNAWNTAWSGREAFTATDGRGYRVGAVFSQQLMAHRVIWAMVHGEWPDQTDHINHDTADNRISNLRNVSHQENASNRAMMSNNSSGVMGVNWDSDKCNWRARIMANGKRKSLGNFNCITAAMIARKLAEQKYGFHENHGVTL